MVQNRISYLVNCHGRGSKGCVVLEGGMDASQIREPMNHEANQLKSKNAKITFRNNVQMTL